MLLCLAALLTCAALSFAEKLPVKLYTSAEGLARDTVNQIVADSHGFLWFCTGEGLARFDGYRFSNFGISDGLPSRSVNQMVETRSGQYWVATNDGLCRFDPTARAGQPRFVVDYQGDATRGQMLTTLLEDRAGVLWVGGGKDLFRLELVQGRWVNTRVPLRTGSGAAGYSYISSLAEDRQGALWIASGDSLFRRWPDGRLERFAVAESLGNRVPVVLCADRAGQLWVGTDKGLVQLVADPQPGRSLIARLYTTQDGLSGNSIRFLFQAADGRLWVVAQLESGLNVTLTPSDRDKLRFRSYTRANGLTGLGPLAEDRHGNLWLGTESSGALKIARNGFVTFDESDGMFTSRIGSLLLDQSGVLCVLGHHQGGSVLQRYNGQQFQAVPFTLSREAGTWGWGWHQIMQQARSGEWWLLTKENILRFPTGVPFIELASARPQIVLKQDDLGSSENFRLYEDRRGDIWLSRFASNGETLARWERSTGRLEKFPPLDSQRPENAPTAFAEDAMGQLWIGYYAGGLARYANGRFSFFGQAEGLPGGMVRAVYQDRARRLWVATGEGGAVQIDDPSAATPHFTLINTATGLASNQATCFTEDQWGRLYVGTGRGVDRLDLSTGQIKHFTTADGLPSNFINVCKTDGNGALWFGTLEGLARLIPQPEQPSAPPPVSLSELFIDGQSYPLSALGEQAVTGLVLEPGQNDIRLTYFGLSYGAGETLRYQYQLEGADTEWSAPSERREINYANLAPGTYRFLVRAVTSDGVLSTTPASVNFQVLPPLWRRWWMRLLAVALILVGLLMFDRYRVKRLERLDAALTESRQLTQQLTAKQSELSQANRTLALDAAITHILVEAATPSEAAPRILRAVCEQTGWDWSALWDVDRQANVLRCASVWRPEGTAALSFEAVTRQQTFAPGIGLPGRVYATRQAHWIEDLSADTNFPRSEAAAHEGLRSGLGFPVLLGSEVIAVVEFFSRTARLHDADQLRMLAAIGGQLGQLIERKRAEEALRESETRFRTLAETASDAIITIDGRGKIIFVNPAVEKVFGYAAAELTGADLALLMPEYMRELHRVGLARYQQTGVRHTHWEALELPGLHRDGREIPLELSFGEFTRAGQRYFTGIARDITERKRAAEALQHSREERLRELERVRRRIATDLHDDIGSSLTQISILSEVLRQRLGDNEAGNQNGANEPLEMIAGASRELVDAMSDIVWAINPQKDHLSDLTQRMRRFAADSLTARNIRFELSLPEADADIALGANLRREVFLIFKESINNMLKHAQCTQTRIELSFDGGQLYLRLRDNGRGFDTAAESEGHGLMSMRDRARGIGGTLEIRSAPNVGTTVVLEVPLEQG